MIASIPIAGRSFFGPNDPVFVIAEAGVNHNGDIDSALQMIDVAVEAGADAVKFQTFRVEKLGTESAAKATYQAEQTSSAESQADMLRKLRLSEEAHRELQAHCGERDILFLSTPFEEESADFLEQIRVPLFKVPSGEVTNLPFLAHVGAKRLPIILSTGMSTLDEVGRAVQTIESQGNDQIVILHCVSQYPAEPGAANLRAMATLADAFGYPVGFSDHTLGRAVSCAAVALGARVVEKHFTLDKSLPGPDHHASLEPKDLASLVRDIRTVSASLGDGEKRRQSCEENTAEVARKSLVSTRPIPAGHVLGLEDLAVIRPGTGLSPAMREQLIGRRARVDIPANTLLSLEELE